MRFKNDDEERVKEVSGSCRLVLLILIVNVKLEILCEGLNRTL